MNWGGKAKTCMGLVFFESLKDLFKKEILYLNIGWKDIINRNDRNCKNIILFFHYLFQKVMGMMAAKQAPIHKLAVQEENQVQEIEKENMEIEQADQISVENQKYPFCIVWTSIPVLTWLIPCIGHTGICTSEGTIHDFGGPYYIAIDNFTFGKPQKYLKLNKQLEVSRQKWDDAVLKSDDEFGQQMHNLFTNNCHSHVAKALNIMKYDGKQSYTMIHIWFMLILSGQYVSFGKFVMTYLPSLIFYGIILMVVFLSK